MHTSVWLCEFHLLDTTKIASLFPALLKAVHLNSVDSCKLIIVYMSLLLLLILIHEPPTVDLFCHRYDIPNPLALQDRLCLGCINIIMLYLDLMVGGPAYHNKIIS